ncbi:MAG: HDOD domain-containing protein [Planctomycetota bacterium]
MTRILFVDDEPRILAGLKRMLRTQRRVWDMSFAGSGRAALEELAAATYDVLVTDMRMPGMDGATLLLEVKERFPGVVRILLTGYADTADALRALPVVHQFLSKPCEFDRLVEVIERSCSLQSLLADEKLIRLVGGIDNVPVVPRLYQELTAALTDPDVSVDEIAAIVEQDMGIATRILQLANSSLMGLARDLSSMKAAIPYLGINILKTLTLALEVFQQFEGLPGSLVSIEEEQAHAYLVARIARKMLADKELAEQAYMAGMLHDVGTLVLAAQAPESYVRVSAAASSADRPLFRVEQAILEVSHSEVGGYLLGLWGLPYPIVEAVANHHQPRRITHGSFDAVGAVHVADVLAQELEGKRRSQAACSRELDLGYLEATGKIQELPCWREFAAELEPSLGPG